MKILGYETHPAADVFPLLESGEFDALRSDIERHGLLEPLWRCRAADGDWLLLDGRNRGLACESLGIEPEWRDYEGDAPAAFVVSLNLKRRHLSASQASAAAAELEPIFAAENAAKQRAQAARGAEGGRGNAKTLEAPSPQGFEREPQSRDQAADLFNVSGRSVQRAKAVKAKDPDLFELVRSGRIDVVNAEKAIKRLSEEQRAELVDRLLETDGVPAGIFVKDAIERSRGAAASIRQIERDSATAKIESEPVPLPTGPFRVIVADPPWAYEKRKDDGSHRTALTYPTMTTDEVCAMGVGDIAHDDCVLWLWTTNAFMRDAYRVLDAWGFQEKTILTWAKDRMGTGDWLRGKTEHAIMAVRGKPHVVLTNQTTLLHGEVREHSRKPVSFYEMVEALCPGSKVEIFGREGRDGWQTWGAESEKFDAA